MNSTVLPPVSLVRSELGMPLHASVKAQRNKKMVIPDFISQTDAYKDAVEKFAQRCADKLAFDGQVCLPLRIEYEGSEVMVHVAQADYSQAVGMHAYFATQVNDAVNPNEWTIRPTASLGVDTMVITADSKVLVSRRSDSVMKWPNALALGFGEGVGMQDEGNLLRCGARCLSEELGVDGDSILPYMSSYSFALETQYKSWTLYAVADLRGLPLKNWGAEAMLNHANSAVDGWEAQSIEAIDIEDLQRYLEGQKLTPGSALLNEFFISRTSQRLVEQGGGEEEKSRFMRQAA